MARRQRRNPGKNYLTFDIDSLMLLWAEPEGKTDEQIRNNAQGPVDAG